MKKTTLFLIIAGIVLSSTQPAFGMHYRRDQSTKNEQKSFIAKWGPTFGLSAEQIERLEQAKEMFSECFGKKRKKKKDDDWGSIRLGKTDEEESSPTKKPTREKCECFACGAQCCLFSTLGCMGGTALLCMACKKCRHRKRHLR